MTRFKTNPKSGEEVLSRSSTVAKDIPCGRFKSSMEGMTPRQAQLEILKRYSRDIKNSHYADEMLMADPHYSGYFSTSSPSKEMIMNAIAVLSFMRVPGKEDPDFDNALSEIAGISPDKEIRDKARKALKPII